MNDYDWKEGDQVHITIEGVVDGAVNMSDYIEDPMVLPKREPINLSIPGLTVTGWRVCHPALAEETRDLLGFLNDLDIWNMNDLRLHWLRIHRALVPLKRPWE